MEKQGLYANINKRKRLGISRPKSKSTVSKETFLNMKKGFPKKKMVDGGSVKGQKEIQVKKTIFKGVF
jgi:hypothetical protein